MSDVKPKLTSLLRDTARVLETRGNTCDAMRAAAAADEIEQLQADVGRLTRERDALVESCLKQYHNDRWGVHLGNYHVGVFDTKDEAIRELFGCLFPGAPAADPAVAGLVAAFGLPTDPETLDRPQSGASEGRPHDG